MEELLERLARVEQWEPPRKVRGREWDDRKFYESVRRQFAAGKVLSPRQMKALHKLAAKYRVTETAEAGDG